MTGKHTAEVQPHERICVTGSPYLVYVDKSTDLEFRWTGHHPDPIEVIRDDEVTNLIEYTADGHRPLLPPAGVSLVGFFMIVCAEWVTAAVREWPFPQEEPRMVREVARHG